MNVLVLEDRGSASYYMKLALEQEGHRVLEAFNPLDAQSHWNDRERIPIHCMIVDLNLPSGGLSKEEVGRSEGGLLSGWQWLTGHVFQEWPQGRQRVIIYSDYLPDLRIRVQPEELAGIRLVTKKGSTSSATEILNHIRAIEKLLPKSD